MWNVFESTEFIFAERATTVVYPKGTPHGKMVWKQEYLGDFATFDIAMPNRGYYLTFISHQSRRAHTFHEASMELHRSFMSFY